MKDEATKDMFIKAERDFFNRLLIIYRTVSRVEEIDFRENL